MIVAATIGAFLLGLALFHATLLPGRRFQLSPARWEAVDYIWYGAGIVALLIGSYQVIAAIERAKHADALRSIERNYFLLERLITVRQASACSDKRADCVFLTELQEAIRETEFTPGWPLGPLRFRGRVFDSFNRLIKERAAVNGINQVDGFILDQSTRIMDMVGSAQDSEAALKRFIAPLWVMVTWPLLIGLLIALRFTKVTYKVREKT